MPILVKICPIDIEILTFNKWSSKVYRFQKRAFLLTVQCNCRIGETMYRCVLNSVVKISMTFAKYFEYYTVILREAAFCGHAVVYTFHCVFLITRKTFTRGRTNHFSKAVMLQLLRRRYLRLVGLLASESRRSNVPSQKSLDECGSHRDLSY